MKDLGLPKPDYNLRIKSHEPFRQCDHTGRIMIKLEEILLKELPSVVLVQGDTNSAFAGGLAASKISTTRSYTGFDIKVAHVEAGLRSYDRSMPEEINRVLTDHVSDLLFAPTKVAVNNLLKEGIAEKQILLVGDVMYDAALYFGEKAELKSDILSRLKLISKKYVLTTIHRAENTDDLRRFKVILDSLSAIARMIPVIFPVHPRTKKIIAESYFKNEHILFVEPVGYLDMVKLEKNAALIVTDSGGVQKEAYFHRTPCVTVRDETEWIELIESGWNRLAPPDTVESVKNIIIEALDSPLLIGEKAYYGIGKSAELITKEIIEAL